MGVTGFYRRLWDHLCFSHDVYIGRHHQNRQNLSANTFNGQRLARGINSLKKGIATLAKPTFTLA
jgi:hypothetical protein